jgi:uncharacterized protein Yka (UPF0111/DUF47 family)
MYKNLILSVRVKIYKEQNRDSFKEFVQKRVRFCKLVKDQYDRLFSDKNESGKYNISIWSSRNVDDRLVTFVHEIVHIFFLDEGVPGMYILQRYEDEYSLLEEIVQEISEEIVSSNQTFVEELFKQSFGFSVYSTPTNIQEIPEFY